MKYVGVRILDVTIKTQINNYNKTCRHVVYNVVINFGDHLIHDPNKTIISDSYGYVTLKDIVSR